jgi:hypothetical protein
MSRLPRLPHLEGDAEAIASREVMTTKVLQYIFTFLIDKGPIVG